MSKLDLSPFFDEEAYNEIAAACNEAVRDGRWDPDGRALSDRAYQMYVDARRAEDVASGLGKNEMWNHDDQGNRVGKIVFVPISSWESEPPVVHGAPEPERCPSCNEWLPMVTAWGTTNRLVPMFFINFRTGKRSCGKCTTNSQSKDQ